MLILGSNRVSGLQDLFKALKRLGEGGKLWTKGPYDMVFGTLM